MLFWSTKVENKIEQIHKMYSTTVPYRTQVLNYDIHHKLVVTVPTLLPVFETKKNPFLTSVAEPLLFNYGSVSELWQVTDPVLAPNLDFKKQFLQGKNWEVSTNLL